MNRSLALQVADAVLYEGYLLYPYRPSAIKNRQRYSFGILFPPGFAEVRGGTERAGMHSECVLVTNGRATLHVELRFLHLLARQVMAPTESGWSPVPSLSVDGRLVESWDEACQRSVELTAAVPGDGPTKASFCFPASNQREALRGAGGREVGRLQRAQQEVSGTVTVTWYEIGDHTFKLAIDVTNESYLPAASPGRNEALLHSLLSAHTILTVEDGEFVSLLDPPEDFREAVSLCRNVGNFPVLVGEQDARDMLLCSPIVLYDYPQVAPESAGDFYDATEIDEMLTLRVLTLTEEEKDEMRLTDEHACRLLERTEQTARRQLQRTHGAIRSLRRVSDDYE